MSDQAKALIWWIVIGVVAGWLASLIVGGPGSLIGYLIAGLIGSVVGGFLAQAMKLNLNFGNRVLEQVVISVIGAIIVIIVARLIIA